MIGSLDDFGSGGSGVGIGLTSACGVSTGASICAVMSFNSSLAKVGTVICWSTYSRPGDLQASCSSHVSRRQIRVNIHRNAPGTSSINSTDGLCAIGNAKRIDFVGP